MLSHSIPTKSLGIYATVSLHTTFKKMVDFILPLNIIYVSQIGIYFNFHNNNET